MHLTTQTILWLFPVAFMVHDFEEIVFWEVWLKRHREDVLRRLPAFLSKRASRIMNKTTAESALPIGLIFLLCVISVLLAVETGRYHAFLLASSLFFVHGFMHLGQSLLLRRYVPAVITSAAVVIPYGVLLYERLIDEGIVTLGGLGLYSLGGAVILLPFLLVLHQVGEFVFQRAVRCLGPRSLADHRTNDGLQPPA